MKDKKSLYLAVILGLFIVAVGMISFIIFSNVKENNKVFINNEVQLGDSVDWDPSGSDYLENFSGDSCKPFNPPTSATNGQKYKCGDKTTDCSLLSKKLNKQISECYYVRTYSYNKKDSSTATPSSDTKKKLGESCSKDTDCSSGYCKNSKCDEKNTCKVLHCKECTPTDNSRCQKCEDNYKLAGYGYSCVYDGKTPGETNCDVPNCEKCVSGKSYICSLCNSGYKITSGGTCEPCKQGQISNNSRTACYYPKSNPSSSDKCYRDTNNDYQVGNFNNQPGYTLVSNETKNCNNIKVKKVDSNKTVLTGATITFTDSSVPPITRTFNIGETDINMTNPGTYTIVETVAPTGYQIDNTPIQVIVNDDGTISVTGGTNIDLGTSNGTRNITLSIINNNGSTPEPTVEEYCYVKRGNGTNNEYCFGNTDTSCVGYSEVVSGRTRETCTEDIACYQKTDGTYTVGKFDGQFGYQYFGSVCPACYEDSDGNYRWTNTPNANERPVAEINTIDKCVTPPKMSSKKIIYVVLIIIVAIALFIVLKSLKKGNENNNMSTEY